MFECVNKCRPVCEAEYECMHTSMRACMHACTSEYMCAYVCLDALGRVCMCVLYALL